MCGIVGYIGKSSCYPFLIEGLKKLEYRGYDSAGIAVQSKSGIDVIKTKGKVEKLENLINVANLSESFCGIGHTRWATHGEPSDVNSHPHQGEKAVVVHNGIIENYLELKSYLTEKGIKFETETDTEIIAHLLSYLYNDDPVAAIFELTSRLKGSYSLGIIFNDIKNTIYAVRKDSPLIIGVSVKGNLLASDIPAILPYTKNYYLLEEEEIAVINSDGIKFLNRDLEENQKELLTANFDMSAAEKEGFPHFMLKEIYEQPKALKATIKEALKGELPFEKELRGISFSGRIHIVACGSATHAGLLGKRAIEHLAKIPVNVETASEFRYNNPIINKEDIVIAISQSGETADTLAALRLAKQRGVTTVTIVNVLGSSISREADRVIYTFAGPEIAVATTKAYICQVAVLLILAIRIAYDNKKINKILMEEMLSEIKNIPNLVGSTLEISEQCKYIASLFQNSHDVFFMGRGQDYYLSCEGSLKLKEISYIHSEAYPAGELKHGTISLVTEGTPIVAVITDMDRFEKTASNVMEVKARGAKIICISYSENNFSDHILKIPVVNQFFAPLLAIVPLQLFAYYISVFKGLDVDKPRNLAKSVTVE